MLIHRAIILGIFVLDVCSYFLLMLFFLLRNDIVKKNYVSFNLIFSFSFFWVSFAYPVFIYDTPLAWFGVFSEHVNWEFLSKASSVCLLFYSSYAFAYKVFRMRSNNGYNIDIQPKHTRISNKVLNVIFVLFIINAIYALISNYGHTIGVNSNPFLFEFFYTALSANLVLYTQKTHLHKSFYSFLKENKKAIFFSFVSILLFLYMGARGQWALCCLQELQWWLLYTVCKGKWRDGTSIGRS